MVWNGSVFGEPKPLQVRSFPYPISGDAVTAIWCWGCGFKVELCRNVKCSGS